MAISYICNRDKMKKNVTVQFESIKSFEKNSDNILEKIKNINKKCYELNKNLDKIAIYNKRSLLPLNFCIRIERINDLKILK